MGHQITGLERLIADDETLLQGAFGCFDTIADDQYQVDRDECLHERSAYEMVREHLTASQQSELDVVDTFWRDHADHFNQAFAIFHNHVDRSKALAGFVLDEAGLVPSIPRSHWWWKPIEKQP